MRFFSRISMAMAGLLLFIICFLIGASFTHTLPGILTKVTGLNNWEYEVREQSAIYYSDGTKMADLGYKRMYNEDFPEFLKESVVAVEDRRFYEHSGLDAKSIGRAIWKDIKARSKVEGASTITQQLARTMFLTGEKTYTRKIKEVIIAGALEGKYSKEAILNMYLNEIYMGRGCSGMGCAARSYFNKDVSELNKAEICMLVGMIQSPEFYAPERNFEGLKMRQEVVINLLIEQNLITAEEGNDLKMQSLNIRKSEETTNKHPYFTEYIIAQVKAELGTRSVYQAGLRIYTTLDSRMQAAAETAVKNNARSFSNRNITAKDISLISIDPRTGAIKAMVGGVNFQENQLNMAVIARQPGSAIKPLYYAAAMNEGLIKTDTVVNNKPRYFGEYKPENYAPAPEKSSVWQALVQSYNVASVEILNNLGLDKAFAYLDKFGISSMEEGDKNLALGLGGMVKGISPAEMAAAYGVFADEGKYHEYYAIKRIEDRSGRLISWHKDKTRQIISSNTARVMNDVLTDVVRHGTGKPAAIGISSAGKTGTTTNSRDLWYMGYIGELSTAVWAGNSDGTAVTGAGAYGGSVCGPVWRDYMNSLLYSNALEKKPAPRVIEEEPEEEETPEEELEQEGTELEPGNEEQTPEQDNEPVEQPENNPGNEETTPPPVEDITPALPE
ncbi:MAG: PBP1A family penicillin-binding protein [Syntrophomonadaceae bacterium]|nr:PBP1A family penicillin-binding protein [Syntrophomonadaceae bacterium]